MPVYCVNTRIMNEHFYTVRANNKKEALTIAIKESRKQPANITAFHSSEVLFEMNNTEKADNDK